MTYAHQIRTDWNHCEQVVVNVSVPPALADAFHLNTFDVVEVEYTIDRIDDNDPEQGTFSGPVTKLKRNALRDTDFIELEGQTDDFEDEEYDRFSITLFYNPEVGEFKLRQASKVRLGDDVRSSMPAGRVDAVHVVDSLTRDEIYDE